MVVKTWLLVFVSTLVSFVWSQCSGNISQGEYDALEALFDSAGGSGWRWDPLPALSTHWVFPSLLSDPCSRSWQGLSCSTISVVESGVECGVVGVSLSGRNLQGQLPSELASLSQLREWRTSNNNLTSTIPSELLSVSSLEYVDVSSNQLTGYIPDTIGLLSSLLTFKVDSNRLTGTIPVELSNLTSLVSFVVSTNELTGSIPSQLCQLTTLELIVMYENHLTFIIPSTLSQLVNLYTLELDLNSLTGTLPSQLNLMTHLQEIVTYDNYLTGTIPSDLGLISSLRLISINYNYLTQSIPDELGNLTQLQSLGLDSNLLTGTLPPQLGSLIHVTEMGLYFNSFTGSIPTEFGNLSSLSAFYLYSTSVTGTVPSQLAALTSLRELVLNGNLLSSTLPSQLCQLSGLTELYLSGNYFTGAIPFEIGNLTALTVFEIDNNDFTGSIPAGFTRLSNALLLGLEFNLLTGTIPADIGLNQLLTQLFLYGNYLTSSIPTSVGLLHAMVELAIELNYLSRSIPSQISAMTSLRSFNLSTNLISGPMPQALCNCSSLQAVLVADNMLSGSMPVCLGQLSHMEQLDVSANSLDGSLESLFGAGSFASLEVLDVSNNRLTGTLPAGVFRPPQIEAIVLDNNCFHGSLPSSMCEGRNLTTLILDGLSSSTSCQVRTFEPELHGVFPRHFMSGSIPSCVWSMSQLQTLHMSGNGLTGRLGDLRAESALSDLSVASNKLTGTIPLTIQQHGQFAKLDVSSNRLSGALWSGFNLSGSQQSLNMSVNRLSGNIPSSFESAIGMNVLTGNLFQCSEESVPQSDPARSQYTCGSDGLNDSMLAWICGVVLVLGPVLVMGSGWRYVLGATCVRGGDGGGCDVDAGAESDDKRARGEQGSSMRVVEALLRVCVSMSVVYSVVASGVYLLLKLGPGRSRYSTHSDQYGWIDSAMYLRDVLPACAVLVLVLAGSVWVSVVTSSVSSAATSEARGSTEASKWCWSVCSCGGLSSGARVGLAHVVNILVILTVNVTYVYGTLRQLSRFDLLGVQAAMAVFKVAWKTTAIPWLVRQSGADYMSYVSMVLVAFIGGPMISAFFSQSSCFLYVLVGQAPILSSYLLHQFNCRTDTITDCVNSECVTSFSTDCGFSFDYVSTSTSVNTGWMYSYQCSSALIMDYVPVFLFSYLLSGVLLPVGMWMLRACVVSSVMRSMMSVSMRDAVMWMLSDADEAKISKSVTSKLLLNVTMLLTFGLADPLLAPSVAVDSLVCVWSMRSVGSSEQQRQRRADLASDGDVKVAVHVSVVDASLTSSKLTEPADSGGSSRGWLGSVLSARDVASVMGVISVFVGLFWSLFMLDMIGDVHGGVAGGCSMVVPLVCIPVVMRCGVYVKSVLVYVCGRARGQEGTGERESELAGMSSNPIHRPQDVNDSYIMF